MLRALRGLVQQHQLEEPADAAVIQPGASGRQTYPQIFNVDKCVQKISISLASPAPFDGIANQVHLLVKPIRSIALSLCSLLKGWIRTGAVAFGGKGGWRRWRVKSKSTGSFDDHRDGVGWRFRRGGMRRIDQSVRRRPMPPLFSFHSNIFNSNIFHWFSWKRLRIDSNALQMQTIDKSRSAFVILLWK